MILEGEVSPDDGALSPEGAYAEPRVGHAANLGFMRRNWRGPDQRPKTLIVTGVEPADGPLVVAGVLRQLGVPVFFFPAGQTLSGGMLGPAGFRDSARRLSETHGTWAARVPFTRGMVTKAAQVVLNPHFLIIMEDIAALAIARERADPGPESALLDAAEDCAALTSFAAQTRVPSFALSLQKAREFSSENVDALAEFAGVTPQPETRLAAVLLIDQGVRPMRTPLVGRRAAQGAVDSVQARGGVLRGWAKIPLSGERVSVRVLLSGEQIAETPADIFREDLLRHAIGDGYHGFEVNVSKYLRDGSAKFEVLALPDLTLLGIAEMSLEGGRPVG